MPDRGIAHAWQLRAKFAAALSRMYGSEVPAYDTLVQVSAQINADHVDRHPQAQRLGSLDRVTAERHGAVRVGTAEELADVADLFSAFGMYPVGFYDLRTAASPVPVVSTAFRPIDPDELARNPFRVFTSMLATSDTRFFDPDLRGRVEAFLARRRLFDPALIGTARRIAAAGGCPADEADEFVAAAVACFALSREPIDRGWYDELSAVSAVAADIAGVGTTHINHLTPRVLDIDALHRAMTDRGITMIDDIQGPPAVTGPQVLLRQTSFRALAEPRRFRAADGHVSDGTLRVRFGEVEQRGVALTPLGRARYDAAMAEPDPGAAWGRHFPDSDAQMCADGLAYYHGGDPARPVVYEDFLPASAAGIFRSNLNRDAPAADRPDDSHYSQQHYSQQWMADRIGHQIHDPYELYEKVACS
ncbi:2-oxoadipate dioxygenase/decarboxylase [Mycobacterium sp. NPDC003323]